MRPKQSIPNTRRRILVVDDDEVVRVCAARILEEYGFAVEAAPDADTALKLLSTQPFDLLLTDLQLPDLDGIELIREAQRRRIGIRSLVISGYGTIGRAVEAVKAGAEQFITKPFLPDELMAVVSQILSAGEPTGPAMSGGFGQMVGGSESMRALYRTVEKIAGSDCNVLLLGETGTGKDLLARALHECSRRRGQPFVAVNCAVLSEELLESELFGHERDVVGVKHGLFEVARKGTLFLEEIADLSLSTQAKLLNVLERQRVRPVGSAREIPVDVRLIAATTKNVGHSIEAGAFRQDLFHRLNQVSLMLPPLRDRQEDIPSLVTHFLRQFAVTHFRKVERVTPEAMERLLVYDYPGNVRELRSAIERAVLLAEGPNIMPSHLPPSIQAAGGAEVRPLFSTLEEQERHYIAKVLQVTRGHRGEAARILGIDRRTLYDKIRRYGLVVTHGTGKPGQHAAAPHSVSALRHTAPDPRRLHSS